MNQALIAISGFLRYLVSVNILPCISKYPLLCTCKYPQNYLFQKNIFSQFQFRLKTKKNDLTNLPPPPKKNPPKKISKIIFSQFRFRLKTTKKNLTNLKKFCPPPTPKKVAIKLDYS